MSERPEPVDFGLGTRPGWRYVLWFGWNFLALAWVGVGVLTAAVTDFVCSHWLRTEQPQGAVAIAVGFSVLAADIACRSRDSQSEGWRRYVSPFSGGAILFIPAWFVGVGIIVTGIVMALGRA